MLCLLVGCNLLLILSVSLFRVIEYVKRLVVKSRGFIKEGDINEYSWSVVIVCLNGLVFLWYNDLIV